MLMMVGYIISVAFVFDSLADWSHHEEQNKNEKKKNQQNKSAEGRHTHKTIENSTWGEWSVWAS